MVLGGGVLCLNMVVHESMLASSTQRSKADLSVSLVGGFAKCLRIGEKYLDSSLNSIPT